MELSQIKMVVTDMDGTLLNSNHEVSDLFFTIFHQLHKKGVLFVAASGRQYHSMVDKLRPIKDDMLFIAENGALIMEKETRVLSTPLPRKYLEQTMEVVSKIDGAHPILCTANTAFAVDATDKFVALLQEYYTQFEVVPGIDDVQEEVLKVAVYHFEDSERGLYPAAKHLEQRLKVKVSGANWLDISAIDAHKGYALSKVMEQRGITADEVMVFGDYNNDLEMLQLSNYSFAMANGHDNVKEIAKYETKSNNEYGVERVLQLLLNSLS